MALNFSTISETVLQQWKLGRRTKTAPSGFVSGNAVCCRHRGETADTRGRGGLIVDQAAKSAIPVLTVALKHLLRLDIQCPTTSGNS